MNQHHGLIHRNALRVALLVTALGFSALNGCPTPALEGFGGTCISADTCDGLQCRLGPDGQRRCLPPRNENEAGERCELPLLAPTLSGGLLVDQTITFGTAVDDGDISCGSNGAPDVVIAFTVPENPPNVDGSPAPLIGLSVRIEGGSGLSAAVREASCGTELRFGCAVPGATIFLPAVAPGDYEVVIDGVAQDAGAVDEAPVRLVVERLPCPPGGLPFGGESCLVVTEERPLGTPRVGHTLSVTSTGDLVVAGGSDGTKNRGDVEIYSPTLGRWKYADLLAPRVQHGAVLEDDLHLVVIAGDDGGRDVDVVDIAAIDATAEHVDRITVGGFFGTEADSTTRAMLTSRGNILVVSNAIGTTGVLSRKRSAGERAQTCNSSATCDPGETCVQVQPPPSAGASGVCACVTERCTTSGFFDRDPLQNLSAADNPSFSITSLAGGRFGIIVGARADLPVATIDTQSESLRVAGATGAVTRTGAVAVALSDRDVLVLGGLVEGAPTDLVERFDPATGVVSLLPWRLARPVAAPQATLIDGRLLVLDGSDEPIIHNPQTGAVLQSPLVKPRQVALVAAVPIDGSVVVVGGLDEDGPVATVERLAIVPQQSIAPPPPPRCQAVPVPDDGLLVGSTVARDDTFRSTRCDDRLFPFGRDQLFSFSIDEPSSVRLVDVNVSTDPNDGILDDNYSFILLRGDCLEYEEVSCGDSFSPLSMFVPELPPGDYQLVVDYLGFDGIFGLSQYGGSDFSARLLLGPPMTCPTDERDPADDEPTGAEAITLSTENAFAEGEGRLCPGDIDHLLLEHWGGVDNINAIGVPDEGVAVFRATMDEAASLAAGTPVVATIANTPIASRSSLTGQPPGFYVARLQGEEGAVDFLQWSFQQSFESCVPDAGDSLLTALDNRNVSRALHLLPAEERSLTLCNGTDVDTIIIEPGEGGASRLVVDGSELESITFEAFAVDGDDFGAAVPFTVVDDGFDSILDFGTITEPVAVRIAFRTGVAIDIEDELDVTFQQDQIGDSCFTALPLRTGAEVSGVINGDASTFNNNADASRLGDCTGFSSPGQDVAFAVALPAGATLTATVLGANDADIGVYLLDTCATDPDADICVAGADDNGRGESDSFSFRNAGAEATFFVIVDSFFGATYSYTLSWSISGP